MSEAETTPAKYVFLDVVGFTRNRSVEAQADIIKLLNRFVSDAIEHHEVPEKQRILLPTGDGLCIALLNVEHPYDIHVRLACGIIALLHQHNEDPGVRESRKFEVRIGISANTDNLVTDINGNRNIAGAGINTAQRVMDLADGSQILVSRTVYDTLRQREKYMTMFEEFTATIKHGERLNVYQFVDFATHGLNVETPSVFQVDASEQKLPRLVAHYFANAIVNRSSLLEKKEVLYESPGVVLLYIQAVDSQEHESYSEVDELHFAAYGEGTVSFSEQLEFYNDLDHWTVTLMANLVRRHYLQEFAWCFERRVSGTTDYRFINAAGCSKLKKDWPEIWEHIERGSI